MTRRIDLEHVLSQFTRNRGFYLLGAGASAGVVPLGKQFLRSSAVDYLNGSSFPALISQHRKRTKRIIETASDANVCGSDCVREIRIGTPLFPYREMMQRINDYYAYTHMAHSLAKARYLDRNTHNYAVFQFFFPSVIVNYNLDGLASTYCGAHHRVIDVHGTFAPGYGSPLGAELIALAREFEFDLLPDGKILCEPESWSDAILIRRLRSNMHFSSKFVAIIGYSFGRTEAGFDDEVSFELLCHSLRLFNGDIYVVDPQPNELVDSLSDRLQSRNVFGIQQFWNILAHVFMTRLQVGESSKSLSYASAHIVDRFGCGAAFPIYE